MNKERQIGKEIKELSKMSSACRDIKKGVYVPREWVIKEKMFLG